MHKVVTVRVASFDPYDEQLEAIRMLVKMTISDSVPGRHYRLEYIDEDDEIVLLEERTSS